MKLSRAKTDIYSKYAASRNRCKFVPTLCRLMSPHKENSYIVKSLPNVRLDMLGLKAYHMSVFDSQTYMMHHYPFFPVMILLMIEIV